MYQIVKPELPPTSRFQFPGLCDAIAAAKVYINTYSLEDIVIQDEEGYSIIVAKDGNSK